MPQEPDPDWQWRWYVSAPTKDNYVIAVVWGNKAIGKITVGDEALELAEGETEQAIKRFVQARLPGPDL